MNEISHFMAFNSGAKRIFLCWKKLWKPIGSCFPKYN